jgi:hypothetical protein
MSQIPDFTDTDLWVVRTTLAERYGKDVELHLADVEIRLTPGSDELTEVPALFWRERDASFMICRLGENRFRPQFFYTPGEQFSTDRDNYDNLAECITALLQCQADDERGRGVG